MNTRIFLLLISVFCIASVNAVPVKGLYDAEIDLPVTQSEEKMLVEAFRLAAINVLIKVSGSKSDIDEEVLKQVRQKSSTWVAQHSIESLAELLPVGDELVPGKKVRVTFYQESIDDLLSQNNLPVWGKDRPSVLIWLASEDNGIRSLSGSKAPTNLLNRFAVEANTIGVPIYAPLLDDVDKSNITAADVWGFFEDTIVDASQRYQTDSIAALRVSNYAGNFSGSLLVLLKNGESDRFSLSGETLESVIGQAGENLAKAFSSRYASVRNNRSASKLDIRVSGVTSYSSLKKTQSYIESIGVVRSVNLVQVDGEKVEFSVEIDGDKQKLFNSISLGKLLINSPLNTLDTDINSIASYQYSGVQ